MSNGNLNMFAVVSTFGGDRPEMYTSGGLTDEERYRFHSRDEGAAVPASEASGIRHPDPDLRRPRCCT